MPRESLPVLVTDGEQRSALALVRSCARAGFAAYVCAPRAHSLAGASRYVRGRAAVPDPLREPAAFVAALGDLSARWGIAVLLPVAEPALLAVLSARDRFPGVLLPFPGADAFRAVCDKARVLRVAAELGIGVPAQRLLARPADAARLDPLSLEFPVVLKPARSVGEGGSGRVKLGVSHAANARELSARLQRLAPEAYPLLLQQRIQGPGIGVFLLLWEGSLVASFAHRRIREKPPAGGVSVYRESYPLDPHLLRLSRALLERFGWQGVAMVEYKLEASTGRPYLMEVNGRFWGSLQLAIDAGVDFPALLLRAALGMPPVAAPAYRLGLRSRWWWGDVDRLITLLHRSREDLSLPADAPSRWRSLLDFLILWRPGDRNEIFRWRDPGPLVRESIDWFARH